MSPSNSSPFKILGISGSLRKGSYNTAALRAAQELAPEGVEIEIADISQIPPFNQDLESDVPAAVTALKSKIKAADAILFVTPEYNFSIPGVLKNAIDWCSRPYGDSAFEGKPAAILGASPGMLGSARAQYHLRQVLVFLDMHVLNRPEVMIAGAAQKFDATGRLTDEKTREFVGALVQALVDWTRRLG